MTEQLAIITAPWLWFVVRDLGPAFDAIAIALPFLTVAAVTLFVLGAVLYRRARAVFVVGAISTLAACTVTVVGPWLPQHDGNARDVMRIAAVNVLFSNTQPAAAVAAVVATDADVVVAVEMTPTTRKLMQRSYLYDSASGTIDDEVVYSARWPIAAVQPLRGELEGYGVRVAIQRPELPFVVYAVHLYRPWLDRSRGSVTFATHRRLVGQLRRLVDLEELPTVLAGDLNLVDRTSGYRMLTRSLKDAVRANWAGPTSRKPKFRLLFGRIDHILVSKSLCAQSGGRFSVPGSDHRGVTARVGECHRASLRSARPISFRSKVTLGQPAAEPLRFRGVLAMSSPGTSQRAASTFSLTDGQHGAC